MDDQDNEERVLSISPLKTPKTTPSNIRYPTTPTSSSHKNYGRLLNSPISPHSSLSINTNNPHTPNQFNHSLSSPAFTPPRSSGPKERQDRFIPARTPRSAKIRLDFSDTDQGVLSKSPFSYEKNQLTLPSQGLQGLANLAESRLQKGDNVNREISQPLLGSNILNPTLLGNRSPVKGGQNTSLSIFRANSNQSNDDTSNKSIRTRSQSSSVTSNVSNRNINNRDLPNISSETVRQSNATNTNILINSGESLSTNNQNNNNNEIVEQQHFIASRLFRNRNRARHNSAGTNSSSNGNATNIMQSPFLTSTGLTTNNNGTTNLVFPSSHTTHNVNNIIDNFNLNQQNREHALYQTVIGNELLDANIEYLPDRNQEIDNGMTPSALINLRSAAGTATSNTLNHSNNNSNMFNFANSRNSNSANANNQQQNITFSNSSYSANTHNTIATIEENLATANDNDSSSFLSSVLGGANSRQHNSNISAANGINTGSNQISNETGLTPQLSHFHLKNSTNNENHELKAFNSPLVRRSLFEYSNLSEVPKKLKNNLEKEFSNSPLSVSTQKLLKSPKKPQRKIPKMPYKVLDAPELADDFYLNLVDWGLNNSLAVGLGTCVYLWNASNSNVTKLCDYWFGGVFM